MKKTIMIQILALILMMSGCTIQNPIKKYGNYTELVDLDLSFENDTAVCRLTVHGIDTADSIRANMYLYCQNDDGTWELLYAWKNMEEQGNKLDIVEQCKVDEGELYKLYFTGKCFAENGIYYDALTLKDIVQY